MRLNSSKILICAALQIVALIATANATDSTPQSEVIKIWPGAPPGTEDWTGPETDNTWKLRDTPPLHMISNVTIPTLTVVAPAPGAANGTAMIVCPGGGFQNLAITHEGEMVARWLADRGITAFILKYRVRTTGTFKIPADERHHPERFDEFVKSMEGGRQIAVADATQALRFLRANAQRFGIAADRIGMMGFSAGAVTTMGVVLNGQPADRPNFAAPIYGFMEDKTPPKDGPPLFIAASQDDPAIPATKSVAIFTSWTAADLHAELHIYERGAHGWGMVPHKLPVDQWVTAFEAWLKSDGWMGEAKSPQT